MEFQRPNHIRESGLYDRPIVWSIFISSIRATEYPCDTILRMPTKEREEKIRNVMASRQEGIILVLEDVHDPHNIGAVMRSAEAFGVGEVWIIYEKEPYVNMRRVGRHSSSSANKWLTIRFFRSTKACMTALKRKKYTTIATVLHEKRSKSIFDTNLKGKKVAILLGNEHRGLSRHAIEKSDRFLLIPMRGFVESLNISVTAGILLFELTRQRMQINKKASKVNVVKVSKVTPWKR